MNRRGFFKAFSWILLAPVAVLSYFGIIKDKKLHRSKEVFIPKDIAEKQVFYESVIIYKTNDQIKFYSNKCTHLGCRIRHTEDGKYLCSCHGSQFDDSGNPLKGPASKPLKQLNYSFIPEKNGYLVFEKA